MAKFVKIAAFFAANLAEILFNTISFSSELKLPKSVVAKLAEVFAKNWFAAKNARRDRKAFLELRTRNPR